ncbi:Clan S-, family S54, Rhomboid-like serine peptidase [Tritrichomonas foetus]|uniref:rhomboid protease n=1 Tax=Tritrichomonas foetus TaxID=1144522 RepID=A0A1J4JIT6_9EUKA|nr:Clan S-, family S54, Rhomboid-like serine peptidase [Tritrichomonas foetus]|eukprot:OHS98263.1 Clan S-, family S54, Rhomboid-like serine peptidase [Tritrichomonas foetus]
MDIQSPLDDFRSEASDPYYFPPELNLQFWKTNLREPEAFSASRIWARFYSPCFEAGECCSPDRKKNGIHMLLTFTFYLLLAQIAFYIALAVKSTDVTWQVVPNDDILMQYGAINKTSFLTDSQYYRVLSFFLMNSSIFQVLVNTFCFFIFCLPMEKSWGFVKYFIIVLFGGIIGGLFNGMHSDDVCTGSSCGILAVMGCFILLLFMKWPIIGSMVKQEYAFYIMLVPFEFLATSFLPKVDWVAHLSSFIAGMAIGSIMFWKHLHNPTASKALLSIGIITTIVLVAIPFVILYVIG